MLSAIALGKGVGPYLSGADFTGFLLFLAPLPVGIRLFSSSSPVSGLWWIALTPIISAFSLFVLALSLHGVDYDWVVVLAVACLWLFLAFSKHVWVGENETYANATITAHRTTSNHTEPPAAVSVPEKEASHNTDEAVAELSPIVDAAVIRRIAARTPKDVELAVFADQRTVSRFFNAIRYSQIEQVKRALSKNPILILAKDVYGNTPIEVAQKEHNAELLAFFIASLPERKGR